MGFNEPRRAHERRKWIRPTVVAAIGLIVVNVPTIIHAFFWPAWRWGDWRGYIIAPSYFGSPILVWYALHSIFRILFSRWNWAQTAGFSLLIYLAIGAWVMIFVDALFGGGIPIEFRLHLLLVWPIWLTWTVTCLSASGLCFIFN